MPRFIAFDVETPNHLSDRMSAIFDYFNTRITGISEETVWDAPTFPELWPEIEPLMSGGLLVAHNAVFDMGVLKKCLQYYEIDWKPYVRKLRDEAQELAIAESNLSSLFEAEREEQNRQREKEH